MKWNVEELKNRYRILLELLNSENDNNKKKSIQMDLDTLESMIIYIDGKTLFERYKKDSSFEYGGQRLLDESCNYVINNPNDIVKYSVLFDGTYTSSSFSFRKNLSNKDFYFLVDSFFKQLNPDMHDFYRMLVDGKRIEINNQKFFGLNARGLTHHLVSTNECFINSFFNNSVSSSVTLPHEVAHAWQFKNISTLEGDVMGTNSLFREAYSMFIEYIFLDYLRQTKYRKQAAIEQLSNMDELLGYSEFNLYYLCHVNEATVSDGIFLYPHGQRCTSEVFRYLYSKLLSYYFIDKYRKNSTALMGEIEDFNNAFGSIKDEEIIREYNESILSKSFTNVLSTLNRR